MSELRLPTQERHEVPALLARVPLFQELSATQIASVAAGAGMRHLPKGDILFRQGDEARGFFLIVRGQIKLAFVSNQGNEKVIEIIGPHQSFGEAVMFMERPYPVLAQALSETLLLQIGRQSVLDLIQSDTSFACAMLAGLSRRLHALVADVESYSLRSGTQRVIGYLLQQHAQQEKVPGEADLTLPISKQVLASRLNLTPESLSRVLHELASAKLISVRGRRIAIHEVQRLREFDL